jgi:hypothetical protein
MNWRGWIGSFPVVVGLGVCGCESGGAQLAAADPGLAKAAAEAGGGLRSRAHSEEAEAAGPLTPPAADTQTVASAGSANVRPAARIRARVNNEVILDEEVRNLIYQDLRAVEAMPEPERSKHKVELWKQALDAIIDREVILQDSFAFFKSKGPGGVKVLDKLQEAASKEFEKKVLREIKEKYKIGSEEELKAFFESQGVDLALLRRHYERNFMAQEFTRHAVIDMVERGSGHAQILKYYETHPEEFRVEDGVDWQDLFVSLNKQGKTWTREDARRFAEVLAERVRKGEDFVKLCEAHDDGESTLRHAEGQGHKRGEIAARYSPAVEAALFGMKEGDVAVVEVDGGFRVVRLVKRQKAGQLEFDEKVQKQIKNKLQGDIYQREVKHFINELKRKAVIEYSKEAF